MHNKEIPCDICNADVRMDDFAVTFKGKPICTKCMLKVEHAFPAECLYFAWGSKQYIIEGIIEQMKEERKNAEKIEEDGSIGRCGSCSC